MGSTDPGRRGWRSFWGIDIMDRDGGRKTRALRQAVIEGSGEQVALARDRRIRVLYRSLVSRFTSHLRTDTAKYVSKTNRCGGIFSVKFKFAATHHEFNMIIILTLYF